MRAIHLLVLAFLLVLATTACRAKGAKVPSKLPNPCTKAWFAVVERVSPVGDKQGHGPDPGSKEWMGSLSNKLGVDADLSDVGKRDWCRKVDDKLFRKDRDKAKDS